MTKKLIPFLFALLMAVSTWADSPLTSTCWWKYYGDKPVVKEALEYGCTKKVREVVCSSNFSLDFRLALVNAMSWNINGQNNYELCLDYYNAHHAKDTVAMDADTWCVLGYVKALDNYFDVYEAANLVLEGVKLKPQSRGINMIMALIAAQIHMSDDWCQVYQVVADVASDKSLTPDFSDYAVEQIMEYINLYAEYCK